MATTARVRTTASMKVRHGSTSGWRSRTGRAWAKRWTAASRPAAASTRSSRWMRCRPTRSTPPARRGWQGRTATTTSSATTRTPSRTCTRRGCTR
ncbi:hypothetical protein G6F52_014186 [Rhizopus delemar]|nr:hypothetical protein G6F52_014186 [Rhizopus delemar]